MTKSLKEAKRPYIIAGPCSAESDDQVCIIANKLKKLKVNVFRAGIWKPRTRPGGFEGVGRVGLEWLKDIQEQIDIPVAVEVASTLHVDYVLEYGLDMVWIGARTSANPFLVQEISRALQGTDLEVFVKNPINPDLDLWIGAIERILSVGVEGVGAIHRGFSTYEKTKYRNTPYWQIPIDLRSRFPGMMVLCDPSHIAGDASYIYELSQEAMDLSFDGLMIEVHENPKEALSDSKQQLDIPAFEDLLNKLVIRNTTEMNALTTGDLEKLRDHIKGLDKDILQKICERMIMAERIAKIKKQNNVPIYQKDQWDKVVKDRTALGKAYGLSEEFLEEFLRIIHEESISHQNKVMNDGK